MLLFGHAGITVGAVWLAQKSASWTRSRRSQATVGQTAALTTDSPAGSSQVQKTTLSLDYRLLLVGSLLPDIIDKPLGMWLLREALSNGRVFAHTLLLAGLLAGIGVYLHARHRQVTVLCLALGTLAHLILDQMWLTPQTLFWPLYGLSFERGIVEGWLPRILTSLMTKPSVYLPEIIGALLLAVLLWDIIRRRRLMGFLRSGRVD